MGSTPPRVILESSYHMEGWNDIKPVLEKYSSDLGLPIFVRNIHCGYSDVVLDENELHIRFYSIPHTDFHRVTNSLPRVFGIVLGMNQMDSLTANPMHDQLIKDENGTIVAEVYGSTLFVLFNLPEGRNAGILMDKIMGLFVTDYVIADPQERKKNSEERRRKQIEESAQRFADIYDELIRDRLSSFRYVDDSLKSEEEQYTTRLENVRNRRLALRLLSKKAQPFLKKGKKERKKELTGQFERLNKMSADGKAYVIRSEIHINMGQIDIEYNGRVYDIGEFELIIDTDERGSGAIKCENKTQAQGVCDHPHIRSGSCCFGNVGDQIYQLVETMEYEVLVSLIKAYLQSYNPDDPWMRIERWPIKQLQEREEK